MFRFTALFIFIFSSFLQAQELEWIENYQYFGRDPLLIEMINDNFILATSCFDECLDNQVGVAMLSSEGELIRKTGWGTELSDIPFKTGCLNDETFYFLGVSESPDERMIFLHDFNEDFTEEETWFYDCPYYEIHDLHVRDNGDVIVTGVRNPNDYRYSNGVITYINAQGATEWETDCMSRPGEDDFQSMYVDEDGMIFTGGEWSVAGINRMVVSKMNAAGDSIFAMEVANGDFYQTRSCELIRELRDGNLLLCSRTFRNRGYIPALRVVKMSKDGEIIWDRSYGNDHWQANDSYKPLEIFELWNGNIIIAIAGSIAYPEYDDLLFISQNGDSLGVSSYFDEAGFVAHHFIPTNDNGFAIVGNSRIDNENYISLLKFALHNNFTHDRSLILPIESNLKTYPNPFNAVTTLTYTLPCRLDVELSVWDATGRKISVLDRGRRGGGEYRLHWRADGFCSGVYFVKLKSGGREDVRKVSLVR